jgi:hypothetical protein
MFSERWIFPRLLGAVWEFCHYEESRSADDEVIQLDRTARFAHLRMYTCFVITSPALPGVVIQLDGHGAERLAMTL